MRSPTGAFPISVWLVPDAENEATLARRIGALAEQFDAPAFRPHITLYASIVDDSTPVAAILRSAARTVGGALTLAAGRTGHSESLYKTLYVEFDDVPVRQPLAAMNAALRAALPASAYRLEPHLSLLYRELDAITRAELASRFDWTGRRFRFDRLVAVRPGPGHSTFDDIGSWNDHWLSQNLIG